MLFTALEIFFQDNSILFNEIYLQADRFLDRKLDEAERVLKNKGKNAKKWYSNFIGDQSGAKLNEFHIFVISFAAGVALGIGTA
jgi:FUN14 domain-containing protein 1